MLWKAELIVIVLLPSAYVRSPCTILSPKAFDIDWDHQDHAEASRYRGRMISTTNGTVSTPVKEEPVMLRVPVQPSRQGQRSYDDSVEGGEGRSGSSGTNTNSARSVDIEGYNVDYHNCCDPSGSDNLGHDSCQNDELTGRDSTSPDLFHAIPKRAPSTTSRQASTTQSTSQRATPAPYPPTTILMTCPAYTSAGYTSSTMTTPLNPLSDPNNHGYRYGGPWFGAGATGTTVYSTTWNSVYDRDVHHDIHAGSILRGY